MKKLILLGASALVILGANAQTTASLSPVNRTAKHEAAITQIKYDKDFQEYVKDATEEIAGNDKRLASLLTKLAGDKEAGGKKQERVIKKLVKDILILQVYNDELKTDLTNFINYGEGDWKLFKKEFNRDLTELSRGLAEVRMMVYEDFIAENK